MNIIVAADLHLYNHGATVCSVLKDRLDIFQSVIDFGKEHGVDLIAIAGDIYDTPSPGNIVRSAFAEVLKEAINLCPTIIIPGNHDIQGGSGNSPFDEFTHMEVENLYISTKPEIIEFQDFDVVTFPYPLRINYKDKNDKKLGVVGAMEAELKRLEIHVMDMYKLLYRDVPSLFIGHMSVIGAETSGGYIVTGYDVSPDILSGLFDISVLGHVHKHQTVVHKNVMYAGSIDRVNFGEEHDPKGFLYISDLGTCEYEFVEVDARDYLTIDIDVSEKKNQFAYARKVVDKYSSRIKEAVVRFNIQSDDMTFPTTQFIEYVMLQEPYASPQVRIKTPTVTRQRLEMTGEEAIAADHITLLDEYFALQGLSVRRRDKLLDLAEEIMDDVED